MHRTHRKQRTVVHLRGRNRDYNFAMPAAVNSHPRHQTDKPKCRTYNQRNENYAESRHRFFHPLLSHQMDRLQRKVGQVDSDGKLVVNKRFERFHRNEFLLHPGNATGRLLHKNDNRYNNLSLRLFFLPYVYFGWWKYNVIGRIVNYHWE